MKDINKHLKEIASLGGKARWAKVKNPKQRSKIMKKVGAVKHKL